MEAGRNLTASVKIRSAFSGFKSAPECMPKARVFSQDSSQVACLEDPFDITARVAFPGLPGNGDFHQAQVKPVLKTPSVWLYGFAVFAPVSAMDISRPAKTGTMIPAGSDRKKTNLEMEFGAAPGFRTAPKPKIEGNSTFGYPGAGSARKRIQHRLGKRHDWMNRRS